MITVNFGSFKDYDMTNRFFNKNLAGGALLDIGVYALSLTRSFMQSKPTKILSQMLPAPTSVDEQATIDVYKRQYMVFPAYHEVISPTFSQTARDILCHYPNEIQFLVNHDYSKINYSNLCHLILFAT